MKFRWGGAIYQGQLLEFHTPGGAYIVSRQHGPRFVPGTKLVITKDQIVELSDEERAAAEGKTLVATADPLPIEEQGAQALATAMAEERHTLPPIQELLKKSGELQRDAPHQGLTMQHLKDKLSAVAGVTKALGDKLEARADALMARATAAERQADRAFAPHEAALDAHEAGLKEIEDAVTALGNGGPTGSNG